MAADSSVKPASLPDPVILLKHGITIYESDMRSLDGWLSDTIINFAATHIYVGLSRGSKEQV